MPKKREYQQVRLEDLEVIPELPLAQSALYAEACTPQTDAGAAAHCRKNGILFRQDGAAWLASLRSGTADLIFARPPATPDGDAGYDAQEAFAAAALPWIEQAARVLRPTGSLLLCGPTEALADLKHPSMRYFAGCRWLIWYYRNKAAGGRDWGRAHASILQLRKSDVWVMHADAVRVPYNGHTLKYPAHAEAAAAAGAAGTVWRPSPQGAHPRDVLEAPAAAEPGAAKKTPQPPEELLRRLILAASDPGALVVDPFCGTGTALVAAQQLGRRWLGCDADAAAVEAAIRRIDRVEPSSVEDWIRFDRKNAARRASMR